MLPLILAEHNMWNTHIYWGLLWSTLHWLGLHSLLMSFVCCWYKCKFSTFSFLVLLSSHVPVSMVPKNKIRVERWTCLPSLAQLRATETLRSPVNALPWTQPNVSVTAVRGQELSSCGSILMRAWVSAAGGRRLGTGQPHHSLVTTQRAVCSAFSWRKICSSENRVTTRSCDGKDSLYKYSGCQYNHFVDYIIRV